jgi:hypothetical protein
MIELKLYHGEAAALLRAAISYRDTLVANKWTPSQSLENAISALELASLPPARKPLDPEPWIYLLFGEEGPGWNPARSATQETGGFAFRPRPEYEQDHAFYLPRANS